MRRRPVAKAVTGFGTVAGLFVGCIDAGGANVTTTAVGDDPAQSSPDLVARSGDGRLELVVHSGSERHYRVRTTGWPGREGQTGVACTDVDAIRVDLLPAGATGGPAQP